MLYGTVPFKGSSMDELHRLILKGQYSLKDDISIEARDILRKLLEINPQKRITYEQIYRHPWLADVNPNLDLFNEQERPIISNEALASLTLFVASSKADEMETVKKLLISVLNRNLS